MDYENPYLILSVIATYGLSVVYKIYKFLINAEVTGIQGCTSILYPFLSVRDCLLDGYHLTSITNPEF